VEFRTGTGGSWISGGKGKGEGEAK